MKKLTIEEMKNVVGAGVDLPVERKYLRQTTCLSVAEKLVLDGSVKGMTRDEVAEEIYGHAIMYYYAKELKEQYVAWGLTEKIKNAIADWFMEKGEEINIADNGDTAARKSAYSYIWDNFTMKA